MNPACGTGTLYAPALSSQACVLSHTWDFTLLSTSPIFSSFAIFGPGSKIFPPTSFHRQEKKRFSGFVLSSKTAEQLQGPVRIYTPKASVPHGNLAGEFLIFPWGIPEPNACNFPFLWSCGTVLIQFELSMVSPRLRVRDGQSKAKNRSRVFAPFSLGCRIKPGAESAWGSAGWTSHFPALLHLLGQALGHSCPF